MSISVCVSVSLSVFTSGSMFLRMSTSMSGLHFFTIKTQYPNIHQGQKEKKG